MKRVALLGLARPTSKSGKSAQETKLQHLLPWTGSTHQELSGGLWHELTYCFSGYLLCYRFGYSVGSSPHFLKFQLTSSFTPFAAGKSRGTNRKKHTRARLACVAGGIVKALASRGFIPKTSLARGRKFHQLRRLGQDKQRVWSLIVLFEMYADLRTRRWGMSILLLYPFRLKASAGCGQFFKFPKKNWQILKTEYPSLSHTRKDFTKEFDSGHSDHKWRHDCDRMTRFCSYAKRAFPAIPHI